MRFLNFSLSNAVDEVVVCAHGLKWDLHNLAEYSGMTVGTDGTVSLEWIVLQNPYRPNDPLYAGCAFIFRDLKILKVGGRDPDMPKSEDDTLDGISRILPDDFKPYEMSKTMKEWPSETPFHLLFDFRGGLSIEIAAEEAEFVTRSKEAV
jgi:hypothetical protein